MVKDRSVGLVLAGVVEILIGGVLLLLIPLALFGGSIAESAGAPAAKTDTRSLFVSACVYLALAIFFVSTGIATVRRRRWARTLMCSIAGLWLIVGIAAFVLCLAMLPIVDGLIATGQNGEMTGGIATIVKFFLVLLLLVVYVALPGALLLFLRAPSVRETVERNDPTVPWTDRVTASVLSMILTLVYLGATGLLLVPFGGAPFFGILLGTVPSAAVWILVAALCGWLAHRFYRGDRRACWGTIAFTVVATVSAVLTFLRADTRELWAAFGIPDDQLDLLRDSWIFGPTGMIVVTVLSGVSVIAFALRVRRDMSRELRN